MPAAQDPESPSLGIIFKEPIWDISDSEEHYSVINCCFRALNIIKIVHTGFISLKNELMFNENQEAQGPSLLLRLGMRNPVQFKRASRYYVEKALRNIFPSGIFWVGDVLSYIEL